MWFLYALFFAIWSSFATLIVKRISKEVDPLALTFILLVFGLTFTSILLLFVGGIPKATADFYLFMFAAGLLDAVAFVSAFYAVKLSDISLLAPIGSFSPVFTTLIAIQTLGEVPTPIKLAGILLVVSGAYLLNVSDIKDGILAPFKNLFSHKGVLLFLLSNLLWAITPIFQKKAIFETSPQIPLYASVVGMFFASIILLPFALKRTVSFGKKLPRHVKLFSVYGIGTSFSQLAAYTAFALAPVGYVTTIMRTSGLFTIILGGYLLKEKRIGERIIGATVMIAGAILLVI